MTKKDKNTKKETKTFWLNYFRPNISIGNFFDVDIYALKKNGIKMVICDLDNTLVPHFSRFPNKHVIKFVNDVRKQGIVFCIVSNNSKKRVSDFCEKLNIESYVYNAKKPLLGKIKKLISKYDFLPEEIVFIGDQFITDIWAANRLGAKSILVSPMIDPNKDASTTWFQKILDKFIYKKLQHNNFNNWSSNKLSNIEGEYDIF